MRGVAQKDVEVGKDEAGCPVCHMEAGQFRENTTPNTFLVDCVIVYIYIWCVAGCQYILVVSYFPLICYEIIIL